MYEIIVVGQGVMSWNFDPSDDQRVVKIDLGPNNNLYPRDQQKSLDVIYYNP
jgi:hypothetical protein